MDTIIDLIAFVSQQVKLSEDLLPAGEPCVQFTSGGLTEDVWCENRAKVIELWCYEFSKYAKENPGELRWETKPEMTIKRFMAKTLTNFMSTHDFYCVYAAFAIKEKEVVAA